MGLGVPGLGASELGLGVPDLNGEKGESVLDLGW